MPYNELLGVLRKGGIFSKSLGCVKKIVSYLRKILHMLLFGGYLLVFESFLKTFFYIFFSMLLRLLEDVLE